MFQSQVNIQPAPGVEGDFASTNPRVTMDAGAGAIVAGASGVYVGHFAWNNNGIAYPYQSPSGTTGVIGFVHREQQALITTFLQDATLTVPPGFPVTLFTRGDFWARFYGGAVAGQKVYANDGDGSCYAAATASAPTSGSGITGAIGATFTGSVGAGTGGLLVTAITGYLHIGDQITMPGLYAGAAITGQPTGTSGGTGNYTLNIAQPNAIGSTAGTAASNILDISGATGGTITLGLPLEGTGIPFGTYVESQLSGTTGGTGTYQINRYLQVASGALTTVGATETSWFVATNANPGELAKITQWGYGGALNQ